MFKPTILACHGVANQGKSSTIKELSRLIISKYPNAIVDPVSLNYQYDIKVIITIGKVKIGIESQGDPNSRLSESLQEFVKQKCSIIVCTTRTSGSTVDIVSSYHKSFDIVWISNMVSAEKNQSNLNAISAEYFLFVIEKIMSGSIT